MQHTEKYDPFVELAIAFVFSKGRIVELLDFLQSDIYICGLLVLVCTSAAICWRLLRAFNDTEADREAKEAEDFARYLAHLVHIQQHAPGSEPPRKRPSEESASLCTQLVEEHQQEV